MRGVQRRRAGRSRSTRFVVAAAIAAMVLPVSAAGAQDNDPRRDLDASTVGEDGRLQGAGQASSNMDLLAHLDKPEGFFDPENPGSFAFAYSDMAFTGDHAIAGGYNGFVVYDISDPTDPEDVTAVNCPGGQGDISVSGDLLFLSVQNPNATVDCSADPEQSESFIGIRVFDISDLESPQLVANVPTCRGSHTHTVVTQPGVEDKVWVYNSGTSGVDESRQQNGQDCEIGPTVTQENDQGDTFEVPSNDPDDFDENTETDRFQIEVIEVDRSSPDDAEIVNEARIFANENGNPHGLFDGDGRARTTDTCHDITSYPRTGLAAGACEGNGLLLDITDPTDPERVEATFDENFAYWHSATFNEDGTKVVFTDELGGGVAPTCNADTPDEFGANAIFDIEGTDADPELNFASYYKLPVNQDDTENCVAHNGSLVPVPGRDIMVQAWYQGGISVMDFTDSENPEEIAYFDRGPVNDEELVLGGFWSAYYYDGFVYGTEIARGFDTFELTASDELSSEELAEAAQVSADQLNPQHQQVSRASTIASACPGWLAFDDVPDGVHRDNIACIRAYGITQGKGGEYLPAENVGRDQMASFLTRTLQTAGVELPDDPTDAFDDDSGNEHELEIDQLAELGIVEGNEDGDYDPISMVERDQMASFVVRTVEEILGEELDDPSGSFEDVRDDNVHADNIDAAFEAEIVEGFDDNTYRPGEDVDRDQMASFLTRSLEVLEDRGVQLTGR